jgi:hypothetical protein
VLAATGGPPEFSRAAFALEFERNVGIYEMISAAHAAAWSAITNENCRRQTR